MPQKLTTEEFVKRSLIIHNGFYDYSLSDYKGSLTKIKIVCPVHGEFEQFPKNHLKGAKCNFCANKSRSISGNKNRILNTELFIERATKKHNGIYDYSLVNYISGKTKIIIICYRHGQFEQRAIDHLEGNGCKKCADDSKRLNTEEFIKYSSEIHLGKYIYSATTYSDSYSKVIITCPKHGDFEQIAYAHRHGNGCPSCNDSKGEREIKKFLNENSIVYEFQKKFKDCKNKRTLPFDFYLPEYNLCIEYDGEQHFRPSGFSNGIERFEMLKINDKIKTEYCINNNIQLLRIDYQEKIVEILNKTLINL